MANSILSNKPTQLLTKAKVNVSDWVDAGNVPILASTTDPIKGTTTVDKIYYRRVGDSMEVRFEFFQSSAGSSGSGTYFIGIPNGFKIDTAKIGTSGDENAPVVGNFVDYFSTSDARTGGKLGVFSEDGVSMHRYTGSSNDSALISSALVGLNNANTGYTGSFSVPIQGWSSEAEFLAPLVQPKTAFIKELQASGTDLASTANTVQTRTLNTIEGDSDIISLSSNQFTLNSGKYKISFEAPSRNGGQHQCFLYNVTDSSYVIDGTSMDTLAGGDVSSVSKGLGEIEISSQKTYEIRHWTEQTRTSGLGKSANGTNNPQSNEVYTQVKITKLL